LVEVKGGERAVQQSARAALLDLLAYYSPTDEPTNPPSQAVLATAWESPSEQNSPQQQWRNRHRNAGQPAKTRSHHSPANARFMSLACVLACRGPKRRQQSALLGVGDVPDPDDKHRIGPHGFDPAKPSLGAPLITQQLKLSQASSQEGVLP
jgi:hypothetical protein